MSRGLLTIICAFFYGVGVFSGLLLMGGPFRPAPSDAPPVEPASTPVTACSMEDPLVVAMMQEAILQTADVMNDLWLPALDQCLAAKTGADLWRSEAIGLARGWVNSDQLAARVTQIGYDLLWCISVAADPLGDCLSMLHSTP